MTDATRNLIQRLADELDDLHCQYNVPNQSALINEAHAYLDKPEPEGLTEEEIEKRFQRWWFDEGSGMRPANGEDQEEHARRVSQIAWSNGAYVARYYCPTTTTETP